MGGDLANSGEHSVFAPIHSLFDQNESLLFAYKRGFQLGNWFAWTASSETGDRPGSGRIKSIVPDTVLRGATWCRYPNRGHATTANLALHLSGKDLVLFS